VRRSGLLIVVKLLLVACSAGCRAPAAPKERAASSLIRDVPFLKQKPGFGGLAVLWYNGVYTPLKRLTAFAVAPGALIGALPPAIGWTAAGGSAGDLRLLALAFFFFIWQVPHFWLLLFKYGEEYAEAGFPSITRLFSTTQLGRLTFVWMLATAAASLLLPLYGVSRAASTAYGIVALDAAPVVLLSPGNGHAPRGAFIGKNLYARAVMALLAADAFWGP